MSHDPHLGAQPLPLPPLMPFTLPNGFDFGLDSHSSCKWRHKVSVAFFFLHGRRPLGPHQYLLKAGISIDKCLETTPATTENRIELNGMEWSGVEPPEPPAATSDPPGYGDPFRKAIPR